MANAEAPLLYGAITTGYRGAGLLFVPAAGRRAMIYEIEFGQTGGLSSSDCQVQWDVSRCITTTATGTSVAPNLLDIADPAVTTVFLNNLSAEPTATTAGNGLSLKNWGINQRGSYRWRALDDGDNLIIPNTSSAAVEMRALSVSFVGSAVGSVSFIER